jgi:hypothetical protein
MGLDRAVLVMPEAESSTPPAGVDSEGEVEVEVEAEKEIGGAVEPAAEDILSRRERVIKWLGTHCIYCEVTGAPQSNNKHWYKTCYRSQGLADNLGYSESVDWQIGMDEFRRGKCS